MNEVEKAKAKILNTIFFNQVDVEEKIADRKNFASYLENRLETQIELYDKLIKPILEQIGDSFIHGGLSFYDHYHDEWVSDYVLELGPKKAEYPKGTKKMMEFYKDYYSCFIPMTDIIVQHRGIHDGSCILHINGNEKKISYKKYNLEHPGFDEEDRKTLAKYLCPCTTHSLAEEEHVGCSCCTRSDRSKDFCDSLSKYEITLETKKIKYLTGNLSIEEEENKKRLCNLFRFFAYQEKEKSLEYLYCFIPTSTVPAGIIFLNLKKTLSVEFIDFFQTLSNQLFLQLSLGMSIARAKHDSQKHSTLIAIISILVDSFAHNIAAHSLSAIVWILKQREKNESDTPMKGNASFSKYLCNKAAFWSGITKDFECGGEIRTWYDVIKDFADNPLFLGTIAHSEGIHKIRIKVGCGEGSKQKTEEFAVAEFDVTKQGSNTSTKLCKGCKETSWKNLDKDEWRLFLPNGIVGLHALYTIFENTIRNIKHADPNELEKAKTGGIEFNIFIESIDNKHFNTTIWLGNKSKIKEEEKDKNGQTIKNEQGQVLYGCVDEKINELLKKDIISENGTPRMGGNSQDKICASMLYNNVFSEVDTKQIAPNRYPWLHASRNAENEEELGVIKRSFYVWKGAVAVKIMQDTNSNPINETSSANSSNGEKEIIKIKVGDLKYENPARFKFVIVPKSEENSESESVEKEKLAEIGIVRIMEESECSGDDLDSLYKAWNEKWIKCDRSSPTVLGKTDLLFWAVCYCCNDKRWKCYDFTKEEIYALKDKEMNSLPSFMNNSYDTIFFKHRTDSVVGDLSFANHRDFIVQFIRKEGFLIKEDMKDKFIETLLTNIEVYDNRIFDRVNSREKKDILSKKLFLHIYNEEIEKTDFSKKAKESKANFIIIHLSYIEKLGFAEEKISEFIDKHFKHFLDDNSKLVITTGRGRGEWHNCLEKKYKPHVLFKPIDSLLEAVEDGLIDRDDFQVKYNLVKVLFGS